VALCADMGEYELLTHSLELAAVADDRSFDGGENV